MEGSSRIFLNVILVSKQPSKVKFWSSKLIFQFFDPSKLNLNAPNTSKTSSTIGPQCLQEPGILEILETTHSKNQPSWQPINQTSKLDSHPGSHSIKPVNCTAILAATQSKPVNESWRPIGRLKGGSGGAAALPGRIR